MSIKDVGADFIGQNGISGCIYKDLAETLPRPLQQAFFRIFHWVISCFYLVSLKNVGSILLNNMSRVSNKYHPPAQQNTDFHSFLPTVRPATKSNTIKGHRNTWMKASRGNHNSLGWVKYLTMSRT
jgi:hypothetical protein